MSCRTEISCTSSSTCSMGNSGTVFKCGRCGLEHEVTLYPSINVQTSPELREKVKSGEIFVSECPHCGYREIIKYNTLYHDPSERVIVCLTDVDFHSDGMEGYVCRKVSDVGSFIEKVKIFDAGLDDVTVEICKFVTRQELGKDADLKFFRFSGADNEITFTYPQDGQMEMVNIGFNVYEDCAAVVKRNPPLREGAAGMARVDADWLKQYIG